MGGDKIPIRDQEFLGFGGLLSQVYQIFLQDYFSSHHIDKKVKVLRNKEVPLVQVQWPHRKGSEWTWEPESEIREQYPELFLEVDFERKF